MWISVFMVDKVWVLASGNVAPGTIQTTLNIRYNSLKILVAPHFTSVTQFCPCAVFKHPRY